MGSELSIEMDEDGQSIVEERKFTRTIENVEEIEVAEEGNITQEINPDKTVAVQVSQSRKNLGSSPRKN